MQLSTLLDGIADGTVVLPNFQRDFLWSEGDVASLVATVMAGWPAGSLLLMRGAPRFFATRPFEGVPDREVKPDYVVLDGQQRLTGLFRALRGVGPHVYAVDLDRAGEAPDLAERLEEAIVVVPRTDWDELPSFGTPETRPLVPLYALTSAPDFFDWRDRTVAALSPETRLEASGALTAAYKRFLGTVNHYEFASTILEPDLPAEAVARIFERINKGGTRLSTFDLLVARVFTSEWNLRHRYEQARRETEHIDVYLGDEGLPVIQGIALRKVGDVRRPALLELEAPLITEEWDAATEAMDQALGFLVQTGMRNPAWLPYRTLILPLAALARDFRLGEHRELLESWLWSRSFGMEYDVASSTKAAADYLALKRTIEGTSPAPIEFRIDPGMLWRATRRQHAALWRTFLSLLLRRGAVDPYTGAALTPTAPDAGQTVVSALFARPSASDSDDAPHLWVLSQMLVQRGAQQRARGRSMLAVLIDAMSTDDAMSRRLATHFLTPEAIADAAGSPEDLMATRLKLITTYVTQQFPLVQLGRGEPADG